MEEQKEVTKEVKIIRMVLLKIILVALFVAGFELDMPYATYPFIAVVWIALFLAIFNFPQKGLTMKNKATLYAIRAGVVVVLAYCAAWWTLGAYCCCSAIGFASHAYFMKHNQTS